MLKRKTLCKIETEIEKFRLVFVVQDVYSTTFYNMK